MGSSTSFIKIRMHEQTLNKDNGNQLTASVVWYISEDAAENIVQIITTVVFLTQ